MQTCSKAIILLQKRAVDTEIMPIADFVSNLGPQTIEFFKRAGFSPAYSKQMVTIMAPAMQADNVSSCSVRTFLPCDAEERDVGSGHVDLQLSGKGLFDQGPQPAECAFLSNLRDATKAACAICGAAVKHGADTHCQGCEFISVVVCQVPDVTQWKVVPEFEASRLQQCSNAALIRELSRAYKKCKGSSTVSIRALEGLAGDGADFVCSLGGGVFLRPLARASCVLVRVGYDIAVGDGHGRHEPCLVVETCTRDGLACGLHALASVARALFHDVFKECDISIDVSLSDPSFFKQVLDQIDRNLITRHYPGMGFNPTYARVFFQALVKDCMFMESRGTNYFFACDTAGQESEFKPRDLCRAFAQTLRLYSLQDQFTVHIPDSEIDPSSFIQKMTSSFSVFPTNMGIKTVQALWNSYELLMKSNAGGHSLKASQQEFVAWFKRSCATWDWKTQINQRQSLISADSVSLSALKQLLIIQNRYSKHMTAPPRVLQVRKADANCSMRGFEMTSGLAFALVKSAEKRWELTDADREYDELVKQIDDLLEIENGLYCELRRKRASQSRQQAAP